MQYSHTQSGRSMILIMILAILLMFGVVLSDPDALAGWFGLVILCLIAWLFSSLTIQVGEGELRWHFNLGFWRKSIPLAEIESAASVRLEWYYGLGIRRIPSGWMYNVSGLDAVELRLRSGEVITLGTDDAEGLLAGLRNQLD